MTMIASFLPFESMISECSSDNFVGNDYSSFLFNI